MYKFIQEAKYPATTLKYQFPPQIPPEIWDIYRDYFQAKKTDKISDEQYLAIKINGVNFRENIKLLQKVYFFETGFSFHIGVAFQAIDKYLMEKFGAIWGFTQQDKIVLIIPPGKNSYSRDKLISLVVSATTRLFFRLFPNYFVDFLFEAEVMPFNTEHEAFEAIIYESYFCGIQAIDELVEDKTKKTLIDKIASISSKLPLNQFQAFGILYRRSSLGEEEFSGSVIVNVKEERV